jgi:hypothetical protein
LSCGRLKGTSPTSVEQLKKEILKLWVIRMEDFTCLKNMAESMPLRLQEVIEWGGNMTNN